MSKAHAHATAQESREITLGGAIDLFLDGAVNLSRVGDRPYSDIGRALVEIGSALRGWHYSTCTLQEAEERAGPQIQKIVDVLDQRQTDFFKNETVEMETDSLEELFQVADALHLVLATLGEGVDSSSAHGEDVKEAFNHSAIEALCSAFEILAGVAALSNTVIQPEKAAGNMIITKAFAEATRALSGWPSKLSHGNAGAGMAKRIRSGVL